MIIDGKRAQILAIESYECGHRAACESLLNAIEVCESQFPKCNGAKEVVHAITEILGRAKNHLKDFTKERVEQIEREIQSARN